MKSIEALRAQIDKIDKELLEKFSTRAKLAKQIAKIKEQSGDKVFYRPAREAQILKGLVKSNKGPLDDRAIYTIFKEIISACLYLEQPLKIAFLGPHGTFTQEAAHKHFGKAVTLESFSSIDMVFREVSTMRCDYGVVPIENSTEGMVTHTMDMLIDAPFFICGEVELRIHHHLLSFVKTLQEIDILYAHQQSFSQCRDWIQKNLSKVQCHAVNSNAEGVLLAKKEKRAAAIAGAIAADIHQVPMLAKNIEDYAHNTTRFLVLGRELTPPSGQDKTSILLATNNESGALHELLSHIKDAKVNMTRIESRPTKKNVWDYFFFIDMEGHINDSNVAYVIEKLKQKSSMLKHLGSYPRAINV